MKKVGIFWYYQQHVMGLAQAIDLSTQDSLGLIDSPYTHVEYWEILKGKSKELYDFEYEEIPRGRVIYDVKTKKSYVYMDAKLLKTSIAHQVSEFFNLDFKEVIWKKDPHYKT